MLTVISSNCSCASPLQTWIQEYGYQLLFMPLGVEDFFLNLGKGGREGGKGKGGREGRSHGFFSGGREGNQLLPQSIKRDHRKLTAYWWLVREGGGGDGVIWMLQSSVSKFHCGTTKILKPLPPMINNDQSLSLSWMKNILLKSYFYFHCFLWDNLTCLSPQEVRVNLDAAIASALTENWLMTPRSLRMPFIVRWTIVLSHFPCFFTGQSPSQGAVQE